MSTEQQKKIFRLTAKTIRREALANSPDAVNKIQEHLLALPILKKQCVISGFWPLTDELDILPILHELHHLGHQVLLPIMQGTAQPLLFGTWQPNDALVKGAFNTKEPSQDKALMTPEIILTPLLAFDRRGYRMGYGGGFYDRTLAKLVMSGNVISIGLGLAAQEVPQIITDTYDMPLDYIVTDQECILC